VCTAEWVGAGVVEWTELLAVLGAGGGTDEAELVGLDAALELAAGWLLDVQAASGRAAVISAVTEQRTGRRTRPGCHEKPMRIRGWVDGASHRMIVTRLLIGIETQPAVGLPSVTCRKNALPPPCRTGPAFGVL
jgi:hypothetical protein